MTLATPDLFATLPTPDFWTEEEKKLWDTMVGLVIAIFLVGGASGIGALPEGAAQIADGTAFNLAIITFLNTYRLDTVAGISATTADAAIKIITDWIASGDNMAALKASLEPLFGATRAEIIAITEITRIFAAGNKAAWLSTGLVAGLKWQTARDERVCPLCGPLHGMVIDINGRFGNTAMQIARSPQMQAILGERWTVELGLQRARTLLKHGGKTVEFPPRHPRCRCYILPVFSLSMFERRLEEILR